MEDVAGFCRVGVEHRLLLIAPPAWSYAAQVRRLAIWSSKPKRRRILSEARMVRAEITANLNAHVALSLVHHYTPGHDDDANDDDELMVQSDSRWQSLATQRTA